MLLSMNATVQASRLDCQQCRMPRALAIQSETNPARSWQRATKVGFIGRDRSVQRAGAKGTYSTHKDRWADSKTALRKPPLGLLKKKCFQTRTRFRFLRANRFAREWITSTSCEQCFLFFWSLLFCCFAQLLLQHGTTGRSSQASSILAHQKAPTRHFKRTPTLSFSPCIARAARFVFANTKTNSQA